MSTTDISPALNGDAPVSMNLRGQLFQINREELMALPESILLCLFPNGLVLNTPLNAPSDAQDDTYYVDFDGACLEYILTFFDRAKEDYYGPMHSPKRPNTQDMTDAQYPNPLFHKQAIIVLREELEYFVIPHKKPANITEGNDTHPATDADGFPNNALVDLKRTCGTQLLQRTSIFTALQRNVNREKNAAEQHLIEMLCMSGFGKDDEWGYRSVEPSRCCITSIALVLLKTGIDHVPAAADDDGGPATPTPPVVDSQQLQTAQKLLLFWRKPARKCWWDASEVQGLDSPEGDPLKVWARRIWTLETTLL